MSENVIVVTVDQQLAGIGKVAVRWAAFELLLDMALHDLSGVPSNVGSCLTSQISGHGRKFDALFALIGMRGIENEKIALSAMRKIAEQARALAEKRNRIVHDPWFLNETGGLVRYEITARKTLTFEMRSGTEQELEKIATDIQSLGRAFVKELRSIVPAIDLSDFV